MQKEGGKIIIDVRTEKEFQQERIKDSVLFPLSCIEDNPESIAKLFTGKEILLMCRTARRAEMAKDILCQFFKNTDITVYQGGILKYKEVFPESIESHRGRSVVPIMRQVQIIAGGLIVFFIFLSITLQENFIFGALFVGGGLLFSGLSGTCMMATILGKLPYNK